MPIFKSLQPDIDVPTDITIWDWIFTSPISPLTRLPSHEHAGFRNAFTDERLSWSDVKQYSIYISTALVHDYGLRAGDTISLFSQNTVWYPVAMFAGIRMGAMVSGASPAYNVEEMAYAMRTAGTRLLLTTSQGLGVAEQAARRVGLGRKRVVLLEGRVDGYKTLADLIESGKKMEEQAESFKIPRGKGNGEVCAFLSFSSGTTGLPKAVMIAHKNVIAQCLQVQQITPASQKQVLAVLPLFHITGLVHGMHLPLLINAEVLMCPTYTLPSMLSTIVKYQIRELLLVPPILIRLVRDPIVANYDLSFVTRFSSGAAPLSPEILTLLQKNFPQTGFKQGYGMTESCSCITAHPPSKYSYRYAHTGGTIVANTEVKIVKPDGSIADINEPGEILARGPQIVMGYLNNETATRETFDEDGWLHTGDVGAIDEEGVITITDRIKEMIKVKGIGVAPAELEDLLLGHERVEDVAVMGVKDEWKGEVPKAFVVLKEGSEASEKMGRDLLRYVRERKVRFKWVKEVEFVDEVPKSASGKILRRVLRDKEKSGEKKGLVVKEIEEERARL